MAQLGSLYTLISRGQTDLGVTVSKDRRNHISHFGTLMPPIFFGTVNNLVFKYVMGTDLILLEGVF